MRLLFRDSWRDLVWMIGVIALAVATAGCVLADPPTPVSSAGLGTPTITAKLTAAPAQTLTRTPSATPDVRTPAPNGVRVRLAVAPDSSGAIFAVRNAKGEVIFQTYGSLDREDILYLPPGEYAWSAQVPVPTAPLGCFIVEESSGFWRDGTFTAVQQTIEIEVRFVYVISFCTPTPGAP